MTFNTELTLNYYSTNKMQRKKFNHITQRAVYKYLLVAYQVHFQILLLF